MWRGEQYELEAPDGIKWAQTESGHEEAGEGIFLVHKLNDAASIHNNGIHKQRIDAGDGCHAY